MVTIKNTAMKMKLKSNLSSAGAASLLLLLLAAGCGGGTSTAEMLLMDAPPVGVTSVKIWVAAMQVHVAEGDDNETNSALVVDDTSIDDDGRWSSLTVDRSIDLVQHQGETAAEVLGQLPLPEGKITQLRLVIDTTKPNTATVNGVDCNLDTSKVAKNGVKITHPFKAFRSGRGAKHQVFVDLKLDESLTARGACFELKPVINLHKVRTNGADVML